MTLSFYEYLTDTIVNQPAQQAVFATIDHGLIAVYLGVLLVYLIDVIIVYKF